MANDDYLKAIDKLVEQSLQEINWDFFTKQYNENTLHCFFEGMADVSFYRNFIENYYSNFIFYPYYCNGIENVYKSYNNIFLESKNWKKYKQNRILFFTDKDTEDLEEKNRPTDINIYKTDFYSFENYLASDFTLYRIFNELYDIYDNSFIERAIENFRECETQFFNDIKRISAIILFNKIRNKKLELDINLKLDDLKIENIFNIFYVIEKNKIKIKLKENIDNELAKTKLIIPTEQEINIFINSNFTDFDNNEHKFVRGHYFEEFIILYFKCFKINILNSIIKDIKTKNETRKKVNKLQKPTQEIELSNSYLVELLAPRVQIPETLKQFLETNKQNL